MKKRFNARRGGVTAGADIPEGKPVYHPTGAQGLTEAEVREREEAGEDNAFRADPGKNVWQILAGNLFTGFNLLNAVLALCLALVGSYRNMLFLGVVISNTLIGTVQELRAHRTIRRLKLLNAPQVRVRRDGEEKEVKAESLVLGDVVLLRAGDQIPADAVALTGQGAVNESLLTGESDPVEKRPGDWLLSGSYVSEGSFEAQLLRVGENSYVSQLTHSARKIKRPRSALMADMNRVIRLVSMVLLPLGAALFCKQVFLSGEALETAVPSTVAAMLGMIPEGLMLLTSMALAVGVMKLGRRRTLVQELYGIETLARADVLCLDKTGTLTTGDMTLNCLETLDADLPEMQTSLRRFLGAFEETGGTLRALRLAVGASSEGPVRVLPFSSSRKLSAASFADGTTLILGAPSFVLGEGYTGRVRAMAEEAAEQGLRVLVLCEARGVIREDGALPPERRPLGLCLLSDTLRMHCAETLEYFARQGVTLKVISGDDPRTVSKVARRAGLDGAESWVDVSQLKTPEALAEAAERYTVFGRVNPEQKRLLVEALKDAGHSVAMTGDGVNDIPALKAADCSIAMAGGSDAAKNAAQLTLLDADFSCMPQVVDEGRRVINNISRAASLFLVKTLYSFALSLLLLVLPAAYPFQPIQLTLISTLTIGVPSFFLALEPNRERVSGQFLRRVLFRAIPGAAAVTVCAVVCMMLENAGLTQPVCSTLATLSAAVMGLVNLLLVCLPLNPGRMLLIAAMAGGLALSILFLPKLFFLVPLSLQEVLYLLLLCGLGAMVIYFSKRLEERFPHE